MKNTHDDLAFTREILNLFLATETAEAIVVMDAEGVVKGWGAGSEELLGWTSDEAIGKSISEIFTQHDRARRIDLYELNVARGDGYAEDDRWHLRKDGSEVWVTGTMTAVRGADGRVLGFVKMMRDRTDVRVKIDRLEKESSASRENFKRTQLLLDTLGHELRNPLAPLSMAVHLLSFKEMSPTAIEAIKVIKRQITVLQGFADDLANVTRAQHSGFELAIKAVHIQELLQQVVADLQPNASGKGVTLTSIFQEVPTIIEGDARRLGQAAVNLIGNAIKYTPSGGTVFVKCGEEVNEVVIRIEDTGIGISAEMMPRIFEFFTRDTAAKDMAPDGLGVGLGLVQHIVQQHHGIVAARSPGPGKGSEFTVRIPLKQPLTDPPDPP